ncbi:MAG: RtcB family protein [Clostridia bacterium]|nr:RtcB family protein [Clostridia bacterium]
MIELKGKRNSAIVFADTIDKQTKTQLASLLREEAYAESKIRIMPDTHAGKNVAVGTTMTLNGRVNPALVGVDIGCGMEVVILKERDVDLPSLDQAVHALVPCGAKLQDVPQAFFDLSAMIARDYVDEGRAMRSLGTLGGGNHFIELDRAGDGTLVLIIHSGSRQLGSDVATYYQELAYRQQCKKLRKQTKHIQREDKDETYGYQIKARSSGIKLRREEAILEGVPFDEYVHDMQLVTAFADANRKTIAARICEAMGFTVKDRFSCVHNYIDPEHRILRKGAISARMGEPIIIPLNMRDGAILGVGLGNPEWNFSAPHGAGRICSRSDARHAYTVEEFQREMAGIYTTTAQIGSLDECPMAYKPPEKILSQIGDTVHVEETLRPVYNFKAC